MYMQVIQPPAPKGTTPIVNPDALASVLSGSPSTPLQQPGAGLGAYLRQSYLMPSRRAGMGCAGGHCDCGGKCGHGMADATTDTASPSFLQQLLNPIGADISTLTSQLSALNQQTAAATDAAGTSNLGTWALVAMSGFGLWMILRSVHSTGKKVGGYVRKRRTRAAKRFRLQSELAAL
jgi:hypothetical protein